MKKKKWDNEWLAFSKRTRLGALAFLAVFILIAVIPRLYLNYWQHDPVQLEESLIYSDSTNLVESNTQPKIKKKKKRYTIPTSSFDPNNYTQTDWEKIGLSDKQAKSIINFRDKRGGFKKKEDLAQSFAINDSLYKSLEPFITITPREAKPKSSKREESFDAEEIEKTTILVELNSATVEELIQIKGVGRYFAEEIVKLREKLGGYIKMEQLLEIYYLDEEKLEEIGQQLFIDESAITRLNINEASQNELSDHPLISHDIAKSIIDIRQQLDGFKSLDQLLLSGYIDQKKYKKLKLYLIVD